MTNDCRKIPVVAVVFLVACTSVGIFGQPRKSRFDPDGSFWIHGDTPTNFSEFGGINLNAKKSRQLPQPGLELKNGKLLRFKVLSVKRERFTFTTVLVSKISYSFSGKFLKGGVYSAGNLDTEAPVLEGVLTKYKAGQKVAEAKLSFVYFGGT
ncbi:MAG TPA: hypothetical protein VGQ39_08060 [Pyrinomonadaceae bacterium]|jgi:hypothetical protein|nr:hypothetical protein [Pyrinomonadaceae bacterium]